ncbi:hypothetical protein M0R45_034883 [Rubus argutus]|uniref:Uncharacterized protein n=1 Tax=Rubus argutus TaxID=59490 RepID=A0AAW1VTX6_RUBAR
MKSPAKKKKEQTRAPKPCVLTSARERRRTHGRTSADSRNPVHPRRARAQSCCNPTSCPATKLSAVDLR